MLQIFVDEVIRPLVLWNFGDVPFEISCKSLLKSQGDDKTGQQQGGQQEGNLDLDRSQRAKDAWARRKANEGFQPSQQQGPQPPQSPAFSHEVISNKVQDIIHKVLKRVA